MDREEGDRSHSTQSSWRKFSWKNSDYLWSDQISMAMAAHSSILTWRIPWTEESGGLLSMGSHRVRHDWSDLACMHTCIGEGNGNPLQCSCLENPMDRGAWWAAVYGVAQSQTRLKRLSSSSKHIFWKKGWGSRGSSWTEITGCHDISISKTKYLVP